MMKKFAIAGSNDKPVINLDNEKGTLNFSGSSLPENVLEVFNPVLKWLEDYCAEPNPTTRAEFSFEYLNTASSHMIARIMQKIVSLKSGCNDLSISWYYASGDLDMRHFGEELIELTGYPIQLIAHDMDS
jgi:hypothetical protein